METPEIKTQLAEKKGIQISSKVAKKIAIKDAVKQLQREDKYISESGEVITTTSRVILGK
jgi:hypothetical protein